MVESLHQVLIGGRGFSKRVKLQKSCLGMSLGGPRTARVIPDVALVDRERRS